MRFKIISILLLFIFQKTFSQDKVWKAYELDSIVSLEMPFTVYELDSIDVDSNIYQIYTDSTSSNFSAKRIHSKMKDLIIPTDKKGLKKYYSDLVDAFNIIYDDKLTLSSEIRNNNLVGCKLILKNKAQLEILEMNLFHINSNLYSFIYSNENGLDETDRDFFFNSIYFNDEYELEQYSKKKMSFYKKVVLGLLGLLVLSFILRFKTNRKKRFQ